MEITREFPEPRWAFWRLVGVPGAPLAPPSPPDAENGRPRGGPGRSPAASWNPSVRPGRLGALWAQSCNSLGGPRSRICYKNQRFFITFRSPKMTKTTSPRTKGRPWDPSWPPPVSLNGPPGGPRPPQKTMQNSKEGPWAPPGLPRSAEKRVDNAPGSDM